MERSLRERLEEELARATAEQRAAALIFTGTRGRNALSSALLGSVSAGVVEVADRPVGLVPATVRDSPA